VVAQTTNSFYIMFLAIAFSLKLVEVLHTMVIQTSVDLFFIDWERPESKSTDKNATSADDSNISVWRTYFVANEWNELLTERKISSVFQIIATVFSLTVIGFGNLATADPYSNYQQNNPNQYYAPMSDILRFSLIGMVYLVIGMCYACFTARLYRLIYYNSLLTKFYMLSVKMHL
jgi:meckelin